MRFRIRREQIPFFIDIHESPGICSNMYTVSNRANCNSFTKKSQIKTPMQLLAAHPHEFCFVLWHLATPQIKFFEITIIMWRTATLQCSMQPTVPLGGGCSDGDELSMSFVFV